MQTDVSETVQVAGSMSDDYVAAAASADPVERSVRRRVGIIDCALTTILSLQ